MVDARTRVGGHAVHIGATCWRARGWWRRWRRGRRTGIPIPNSRSSAWIRNTRLWCWIVVDHKGRVATNTRIHPLIPNKPRWAGRRRRRRRRWDITTTQNQLILESNTVTWRKAIHIHHRSQIRAARMDGGIIANVNSCSKRNDRDQCLSLGGLSIKNNINKVIYRLPQSGHMVEHAVRGTYSNGNFSSPLPISDLGFRHHRSGTGTQKATKQHGHIRAKTHIKRAPIVLDFPVIKINPVKSCTAVSAALNIGLHKPIYTITNRCLYGGDIGFRSSLHEGP